MSGGFTHKSRFESRPRLEPQQLIGAADAAYFSVAVTNVLAEGGSPPESVHTDATVTRDSTTACRPSPRSSWAQSETSPARTRPRSSNSLKPPELLQVIRALAGLRGIQITLKALLACCSCIPGVAEIVGRLGCDAP